MFRSILWLSVLAVGCGTDSVQTVNQSSGYVEDDVDDVGPEIEHEPIGTSQLYLQEVAIDATVWDEDSGVFIVEVVFKREDSTVWQTRSLVEDAEIAEYFWGTIPGVDVQSGGMHYYLEATDREGNVSWAPDEADGDPYHFRITED